MYRFATLGEMEPGSFVANPYGVNNPGIIITKQDPETQTTYARTLGSNNIAPFEHSLETHFKVGEGHIATEVRDFRYLATEKIRHLGLLPEDMIEDLQVIPIEYLLQTVKF